jgi:hypothetical protein
MSLAIVLANEYGIVMSADRRLTLAPKNASDNMSMLYPSLDHQQKIFLTKSGHGIAYVGSLTLQGGTHTTAVIKNTISTFTDPATSIVQELAVLREKLKQYANGTYICLLGACTSNKGYEVFKTTLKNDTIESITDEDGIGLAAEGDNSIATMLMAHQSDSPHCLHFSLQEGINYLRFINETTSKLQYYNGELQSVSKECDVLVIDSNGARWVTSPEELV